MAVELGRLYHDAVTVSAHDVAAELRRRLPGLPAKKLQKLLYYCQGYHVAAFGEPLFSEGIEAWDMGPVVADLWRGERRERSARLFEQSLGQAELNTVGYVVSRYGGMTGADLESLTHAEPPWIVADERRKTTGNQKMDLAVIRAYFRSLIDEPEDEDDYEIPREVVGRWLAGAPERRAEPLPKDDRRSLRALLRS